MLIPSTVDSSERFGARKLEARATIRAGSACNRLPTASISSGRGIATMIAFFRGTVGEFSRLIDFLFRESSLQAAEPFGWIEDPFGRLFSHPLLERLRSHRQSRAHSEQLARIFPNS